MAITSVIWGIGFVAQSAAMNYMEPFIFNAARFGLGGLALVPVVILLEKQGINRATVKAGIIGGLIVFIAAALQQWGIVITGSAGKSGFVTGLYIVLVPILGMFVGRKTTLFVWMGAILATIGLYFISAPGNLRYIDIGVLFLIAGAFGWAIHILVIDHFIAGVPEQSVRPLGFSAIQCLVCAAASFAVAFAFEDVQIANITAGYLPVLYSALISVGIAYTLQIVAQKHVSPGRCAVIISVEAVVAAIGEAILLGVFLSTRGYFGGGLIFAGVIISQLRYSLKRE